MAYIFKYSIRTGTPAAALAGQVPEETKRRVNQVCLVCWRRTPGVEISCSYAPVQEVLVDGPGQEGLRFMGRTGGNRTVHFDGSPRLTGELVPVRIDRATTSALYGTVT